MNEHLYTNIIWRAAGAVRWRNNTSVYGRVSLLLDKLTQILHAVLCIRYNIILYYYVLGTYPSISGHPGAENNTRKAWFITLVVIICYIRRRTSLILYIINYIKRAGAFSRARNASKSLGVYYNMYTRHYVYITRYVFTTPTSLVGITGIYL